MSLFDDVSNFLQQAAYRLKTLNINTFKASKVQGRGKFTPTTLGG
jgi:hypothetical protein